MVWKSKKLKVLKEQSLLYIFSKLNFGFINKKIFFKNSHFSGLAWAIDMQMNAVIGQIDRLIKRVWITWVSEVFGSCEAASLPASKTVRLPRYWEISCSFADAKPFYWLSCRAVLTTSLCESVFNPLNLCFKSLKALRSCIGFTRVGVYWSALWRWDSSITHKK